MIDPTPLNSINTIEVAVMLDKQFTIGIPILEVSLLLGVLAPGCQDQNDDSPTPVIISYTTPVAFDEDNTPGPVNLEGTRKQVGLQFSVRQNVTLKNVVINYWLAGDKANARSEQRTLNRSVTASPSNIVEQTERFDLSGSADLEACDAMYYTFAATYRVEGESTDRSFFGQPRQIHVTMVPQNSSNTVTQPLCAEPPPADA